MEPIPVRKIKVTVEMTSDDGSVSKLDFHMDPFSFEMSQSRDAKPIYSQKNPWGHPTRFTPGKTALRISGNVIERME